MYESEIHEMTELLCSRHSNLSIKDVRDTLQEFWKDKIALVWCVEDVLQEAEKEGAKLTKEQAREILEDVHKSHDPTIGVSWDTISIAIQEFNSEE